MKRKSLMMKLVAIMMMLTLLLGSFPVVYAEGTDGEIPGAVTDETAQAEAQAAEEAAAEEAKKAEEEAKALAAWAIEYRDSLQSADSDAESFFLSKKYPEIGKLKEEILRQLEEYDSIYR